MGFEPDTSLNIVHCFRSPIGGIFRHVRDLAKAQAEAGHRVGIVCDSNDCGPYEQKLFNALRPSLALGLELIPMQRNISPQDVVALLRAWQAIRPMKADVVHSHSAKGGVYGRLAASVLSLAPGRRIKKFYCPHGGAMHYDRNSVKGRIYFRVERMLERFTDRLVFVSDYERQAYHEKVGEPRCAESLVYNGLREDEFKPVKAQSGAADFLYIGMMRDLKGPDVFLEALQLARDISGKDLTAHFVGDGPDKPAYLETIDNGPLKGAVTVHDALPARDAFALAKTVVVPSRAESMPYLVLETIAAAKPIVATRVGGIPEILDQPDDVLVEPDNPEALAHAMLEVHSRKNAEKAAVKRAEILSRRFSIQTMLEAMETVYRAED